MSAVLTWEGQSLVVLVFSSFTSENLEKPKSLDYVSCPALGGGIILWCVLLFGCLEAFVAFVGRV